MAFCVKTERKKNCSVIRMTRDKHCQLEENVSHRQMLTNYKTGVEGMLPSCLESGWGSLCICMAAQFVKYSLSVNSKDVELLTRCQHPYFFHVYFLVLFCLHYCRDISPMSFMLCFSCNIGPCNHIPMWNSWFLCHISIQHFWIFFSFISDEHPMFH